MTKNRETMDKVIRWLAWKLPHRLVAWCGYRIGAYATTGVYDRQIVPEMGFMEAMGRWDDMIDGKIPTMPQTSSEAILFRLVKNDLENARNVFEQEIMKYAKRIDLLRSAIEQAKNELSVPIRNYSAPITNAFELLNSALNNDNLPND